MIPALASLDKIKSDSKSEPGKLPGARSKFWGVSESEDRGGGDNSVQFINIGRVGDKSFKVMTTKNRGGGRVGDNNVLTFLCYWLDKKMPL